MASSSYIIFKILFVVHFSLFIVHSSLFTIEIGAKVQKKIYVGERRVVFLRCFFTDKDLACISKI